MRRTFGTHIAGLYAQLPTIVAETTEGLTFRNHGLDITHERGSRAYFVMSDPDPLKFDTVECLIRSRMNQFYVRDIKWTSLRFVEIANVPSNIGERCWRGTKEEMQALVARIKAEKLVRMNSFAPDVDL